MDLFPSPSSSSSSSSPAAAPEPWQWAGTGAGGSSGFGSAACELACRVLCAVATCIFVAVGSLVGAVTGSMIGLATESGILRGAGIGAISGAVFSIEVAESSRDLWHSSDSGVWSFLCMVDIISSLLSGRLVREKISAISSPFAETSDLFETGDTKGLPVDSLHRLPEIRITEENAVDSAGEALCCSVCLQDLQVGEYARRLPSCRHVFHKPCIDCWLVRHGSCPLCRRDI